MKGGIREGGGSVRNAILPWVLLGYIVGNWWHWNMNVYDQYYVYSPSTLSFYSALMNGCLVMAGINFFLCRYTHPGSVPNSSEWNAEIIDIYKPKPKKVEINEDGTTTPSSSSSSSSSEKPDKSYCLQCDRMRPKRSHHCMRCNSCILKKDHHCPWIGNCVGFYNLKYFILLLTYGLVALTIYAWVVAVPNLLYFYDNFGLRFWKIFSVADYTQDYGFKFWFAVNCLFYLPFCGFTSLSWLFLCNNMTTTECREMFRERKASHKMLACYFCISEWHFGVYYNVCEVLGPIWLWLIPTRYGIVGDGTAFLETDHWKPWEPYAIDLLKAMKVPENFSQTNEQLLEKYIPLTPGQQEEEGGEGESLPGVMTMDRSRETSDLNSILYSRKDQMV